MLDTVRQFETPEGIFLRLRSAGALPRAQAWSIDFVIRVLVCWMGMIPLAFLGQAGVGIGMLVMFVLMWFYPVVCEVFFHGQTLGKRAIGLRVVNADGTPVTWVPSMARNLLRVVDMLPGVYGVGLVSTLIDPYGRRLGDIIAGTMVIHTSELPSGNHVPVLAAERPPLDLAADEQAVIVDFAERCAQLTPQRQQELANLLDPLTGQTGEAGARQLVAYANWLIGRP
ncbi:RDD family protein [Dyella tabacisoli]|uniref:RDD family protein n=1 Tax=Dyella tabacisoli TaxID=2282381 RepID=A0A369UIX4_9GAMM|nr:RDD family protein [Dyella tabacisoli]RDD80457.1 RDD family protein [Dyella tabacisoli]